MNGNEKKSRSQIGDATLFDGFRPPMTPVLVRVRDFQRENHDTFTVELDAPKARKGDVGCWGRSPDRAHEEFYFKPGQFNMLYLFAVGEVPISLSGDPEQGKTVVHTIRALGSVTSQMEKLNPGDVVGLRGPFGSPWPMEESRGMDIVIVGGGIGIAPLRPVVYHTLRHRDDYRKVILLYGARSPDDLVFSKELDEWHRRDDIEVYVTVDRGSPSWKGPIGLVTNLFRRLQLDPALTVGLICGPEVMMRFTLREFRRQQIPDDRLFVSLERNMHCAVGFCGHCQFGPEFVCMDGPVFRYDRIKLFFQIQEA